MFVHWFVAQRMGWEKEQDVVWFDANQYSMEEAEAQFRPVQKTTMKNNHCFPYTAYEYDGVLYHHYRYMGYCDEKDLPRNRDEWYRNHFGL